MKRTEEEQKNKIYKLSSQDQLLDEGLRGEVGCAGELLVQKFLSVQPSVRGCKVIKNLEVVYESVFMEKFHSFV